MSSGFGDSRPTAPVARSKRLLVTDGSCWSNHSGCTVAGDERKRLGRGRLPVPKEGVSTIPPLKPRPGRRSPPPPIPNAYPD